MKEWLRNKPEALASLLGRSIAWHHWSNHELDPQFGGKGSGLGITKLMGIGHRCRTVDLYIHGNEKVMSFL